MLKLGSGYLLVDKAELYARSIIVKTFKTQTHEALTAHLERVVKKIGPSDSLVLAWLHHALDFRPLPEIRATFPQWVAHGLLLLRRDAPALDVILRVKQYAMLSAIMAADLEDQIDQKVNVEQASLELYALRASSR